MCGAQQGIHQLTRPNKFNRETVNSRYATVKKIHLKKGNYYLLIRESSNESRDGK
jgi:hypothetical protein